MKRIPVLLILALCAAATMRGEDQWSFKGTVIKMEMGNCAITGFKAAMAGRPVAVTPCPEYTVMTPNVVYVMQGRNSEAFMPLAQDLEFRVVKNEVLIHQQSKSRFAIQSMMLRGEWEREQQRKALMMERSVNYEAPSPARGTLTAAAR